jgi:cytoskeleton protein RodZ
MASVGAHLRELRTRRGVSLEAIARTTRVAPRYLESLEADSHGELPAPVFIRGFIRAYCQALGESPDQALTIYDAREGREPPPPRPAPLPRAGTSRPRARGAIVVSLVLLVVLGMALFTVALVLQPRDRGQRPAPEVSSAPPPPAPASELAIPPPAAVASPAAAPGPPPVAAPEAQGAMPPPAPRPSDRPPTSAAPAAPPPAVSAPPPAVASPDPSAPAASATKPGLPTLTGSVSSPYRLIARVSDPTWIRVRTEDGRTSEETVPAGEVREWVSDRPFVVTIGNAGGVALELNGRALPPLGARGVVVPRLVLPPEPR